MAIIDTFKANTNRSNQALLSPYLPSNPQTISHNTFLLTSRPSRLTRRQFCIHKLCSINTAIGPSGEPSLFVRMGYGSWGFHSYRSPLVIVQVFLSNLFWRPKITVIYILQSYGLTARLKAKPCTSLQTVSAEASLLSVWETLLMTCKSHRCPLELAATLVGRRVVPRYCEYNRSSITGHLVNHCVSLRGMCELNPVQLPSHHRV